MHARIRTLEFWRSIICECLASFFYVFIVCGAAAGAGVGASVSSVLLATALASGLAMATLTQCFMNISGAHINPAVTLASCVIPIVSPLRSAQSGSGIAGAALLYGIMNMQSDWDDFDYVTILEHIRFSPPTISTPLVELIQESVKWSTEVERELDLVPADESFPDDRIKMQESEGIPIPVTINGSTLHSLDRLRPSNNVQEIKMRIDNDYQKFITREGEELFINRDTLSRIDFERIQNSRRKQFTVNLPDMYQVKVNVNKAGKVVFHHHHRRGIEKIKARIIERNRSTGGKCSTAQ